MLEKHFFIIIMSDKFPVSLNYSVMPESLRREFV